MSDKMKLFLLGCAPLIVGFLVKILRSTFGIYGSKAFIFGVIFSVFWYYVGFRFRKLSNYMNSVILIHLVGVICLSLTNLLLVSSNAFPFNMLTYLVDSYFTPMYLLMSEFIKYNGALNLYLYSFVLMIVLFSVGYRIGCNETR